MKEKQKGTGDGRNVLLKTQRTAEVEMDRCDGKGKVESRQKCGDTVGMGRLRSGGSGQVGKRRKWGGGEMMEMGT